MSRTHTFENGAGAETRDGKAALPSHLEISLSQADAYRLALELLGKIEMKAGQLGTGKVRFVLSGRMNSAEVDCPVPSAPDLTEDRPAKDKMTDDRYRDLISGRVTAG